MPEGAALVQRFFAAFNRRDREGVWALCDEGIEFLLSGTAAAVGRAVPYRGREGLDEYLADVERAWEELIVTPGEVARSGDTLLVHGRVYSRNRQLGIRDTQVAWIWELRGGRFARGELFDDPDLATRRFREQIGEAAGF